MITLFRHGVSFALLPFFDPDAFPDEVSHLGYRVFENQSPAELNNRYFFDRSDNLVAHSTAYIVHAAIIKE